MLFFCPFVQRVWFVSPLNLLAVNLPTLPFPQLWKHIMQELAILDNTHYALGLCSYICWSLWKCRNLLLFDHVAHVSSSDSIQVSWIAPPLGFIKINFDAATSSSHHCGFIAAVARDSSGCVVNRFHACYRHIWDPGILEFLALRESLSWAISCGWYRVIFEGDALQVSQAANSGTVSDYKTWGICQDISRLRRSFTSCSICYVSRRFNMMAHELASSTKSLYLSHL
ncbi:uncharacterized protein LOC126675010 [Mercurialis annua]|uniref:uncharacterized protein LOC126675010 n=1 Tax=Mercurialis annua TaxID=3986 RepID=UPI002160B1A6|nr:uncharacterized protein LOC126675010 [Mercurialis annua]